MFWGSCPRQKSVSVKAMGSSTPLGKNEGKRAFIRYLEETSSLSWSYTFPLQVGASLRPLPSTCEVIKHRFFVGHKYPLPQLDKREAGSQKRPFQGHTWSGHGLANCFWKGPGSKYFRFCGPCCSLLKRLKSTLSSRSSRRHSL